MNLIPCEGNEIKKKRDENQIVRLIEVSHLCVFHSNVVNYSVFRDYIIVQEEFTMSSRILDLKTNDVILNGWQ